MKNKILYLLLLLVLFIPFISKAEKFCQETTRLMPGKYLLFNLKNKNAYNFMTDPPLCLSGGKGGEVIPYILTYHGKEGYYDEKWTYINGRDFNCEIITKDDRGLIDSSVGDYYVKKCRDTKSKDSFYFEFNGQKGPLFKSFRKLRISRDGKKLMVILSNNIPADTYFYPSDNDMLLRIESNKINVTNNVTDYTSDKDLNSYAYLKKEGSNYALYYNREKLYKSINVVQLTGFIIGAGPIYASDSGDVYVGKRILSQGHHLNIAISPDGRNYAYRSYGKDKNNNRSLGAIILNGKELPNTKYNTAFDEYGFSDDGSFYYTSCDASTKNCITHFKGKSIPRANDFSNIIVNNNAIAEIDDGRVLLNGKALINEKKEALYSFQCDISPNGKNIFCNQPLRRKGEEVAYFNEKRLPNGTASGYFTDRGDLITMDGSSLWESRAIYKNGKLFAAAGKNERIITNNSVTDKVIAKLEPIMINNQESQMKTFKFYRNNKQIGGEYKGLLFVGGMDNKGESFSIFYANEKFELIREVIKIK